ncbi:cation transporter [Fulvimonas yonginensis]|uniref:Cation transporter n=1 Tax=Fulvimonas yonginensis TaxID=1495200 RepID=A0ABU8JCW0_9GAMM
MSCCDHDRPLAHTGAQRRVLWAVLFVNLLIFLGEFGAGLWGRSTALQSDSLDSVGDAIVYGVSLLVVGGTVRARAGAALLKGVVQLGFAAAILGEVVHRALAGPSPMAVVMAWAAAAALLANASCMLLLAPYRTQDLNMRSVWLCSRNDVVSNVAVLLTTALLTLTDWGWLDLVFGGAVALLFAITGARVGAAATRDLRSAASTH